MEFGYAGGGEIPATLAMIFSADDGLDVGEDGGAPVSQDYGARGSAFNGCIKAVIRPFVALRFGVRRERRGGGLGRPADPTGRIRCCGRVSPRLVGLGSSPYSRGRTAVRPRGCGCGSRSGRPRVFP